MTYIFIAIHEILFLCIILQWLISVDYSLYHSKDHIRRHLKQTLIPILILLALVVLQSFIPYLIYNAYGRSWGLGSYDVLSVLEIIVQLGYAIAAIHMVRRFEKERREPQFLRLDAFMIPFLIGALFRPFGTAMVGMGVLFSYMTLIRRDRFIDIKTELYNRNFLSCISTYWDKKSYPDSCAMIITAPGNDESLGRIMKKLQFQDCFPIRMGESHYVLLTAEVRNSAMEMAENMIRRKAEMSTPPFEPEIRIKKRSESQLMTDFASELAD